MTHNKSSQLPRFSTSCTTQCKEQQECINKHVTPRQSCCDDCSCPEKHLIGLHKNVQKLFFRSHIYDIVSKLISKTAQEIQ